MEQQPRNPGDQGDDTPEPEHPQPADDFPFGGSALEKVSFYLRSAFLEADARGEAISRDDAQAIATLLAPLLDADSAMHRYAEACHIDTARLLEECRRLRTGTWQTREINEWAQRLAHFAATHLGPDQGERT